MCSSDLTEPADIQPSQMPCLDMSITNLRGMTMRIKSCSQRNNPNPFGMPNEHLATKEMDTEPSRVHIETEGSDIMNCVHSCTD